MKKTGYLYLLSGLINGVLYCFFVSVYPLIEQKLSNSFYSDGYKYIFKAPLLKIALVLILIQIILGIYLIVKSNKLQS